MDYTLRRATLVDNPEVIKTKGGEMVRLTVAEDHSKPIYEGDEIVEWERTGVSYFDLLFFKDMAEEIQYFEKGEHIEVTDGNIKQNKWEDDDGEVHYDFNFYVNDFEEWIPPSEREE